MARKKIADNPVISQETSDAARESTELHVPEAGLIEEATPKNPDRESADPGAANFKDSAREAIFARRKEFLEKETGLAETGVISAEPITESVPEEPKPELVIATQKEVAILDKAAPDSADILPKYKIVVDGQSIEYTLEELQQQAQLGVAARKRFDEAARMRQEAQNLMFASQQNSQSQQIVNNQQPQPQPDIPETELRDIAKRLNYGSEEDQVKALKEAGILFAKSAAQPNNGLTPEILVNVATQNAINAMTASQEQEILKNEFKEIISDPAIAYATDFIANQLAQKYAALGQQKSRLELLREAGNTAKERYLKSESSGQPDSTAKVSPSIVNMTNKIERKRAAPQPPTSANKVASSETQSYGVPSEQALNAARQKAFSDIARRRGQTA